MEYIPPYTVSAKALRLIGEIYAALERYKIAMEGPEGVRLRKINHIKTIRGTTAIEGNTLDESQITAILSGKMVRGPKRDIDEIKCAHAAYANIAGFDPYSLNDLLRAHGMLTEGLVDHPGQWRNCNVGVVGAQGEVYHMAPPWSRVPELMENLFGWLRASEDPVLVKSCVFHYEFEFIHPFPDGNGRTGRLWQTALLGNWNPLFYAAPVENIVWAHQAEYYEAISDSTGKGDCGPFVDFMLERILHTLEAKGEGGESKEKSREKSREKTPDRILRLLHEKPTMTQQELAEALELSVQAVEKNIAKLKAEHRLRRIGPDKGGHWEA